MYSSELVKAADDYDEQNSRSQRRYLYTARKVFFNHFNLESGKIMKLKKY